MVCFTKFEIFWETFLERPTGIWNIFKIFLGIFRGIFFEFRCARCLKAGLPDLSSSFHYSKNSITLFLTLQAHFTKITLKILYFTMKLHQKSWKFDQSSVIANFDYTKLIIHFTMGSVLHYNLAALARPSFTFFVFCFQTFFDFRLFCL